MLGGTRIDEKVRVALLKVAERLPQSRFCGIGDWIPESWTRIDSDDPWQRLASSDVLVTASGASVWEAAAVGIPVVLVKIASNQDLVLAWARDHGVPTIDAVQVSNSERLATLIVEALCRASRLPRIANGSSRVALMLYRLAGRDV